MKKENIHPIRQDYLNGMSFADIGRKYFIDPRTAKRYALNNLPLEDLEKRPFTSILDPYKEKIDKWLLYGPIFASTIHDRLIEQGCRCGYTIVNDYVKKKIQENYKNGLYKSPCSRKKDFKATKERIREEKLLIIKEQS
ncbi:MAG: hypothetical protein GX660_06920 [Clostridiaceae bacterium]|nr:hypothetical protein [Clostridiaceae bacterium]